MKQWITYTVLLGMALYAVSAVAAGAYSPQNGIGSAQSSVVFHDDGAGLPSRFLSTPLNREINDIDSVRRDVVIPALQRDAASLKKPKFDLINASDIRNYPHVDKYFDDLDDPEVSHYFILQEPYIFKDLKGQNHTIPAGFIWDGASIPKMATLALNVGNTRYSSAYSEGLVHDWMYRNPQSFSKEDADSLLWVNTVRCKNPNPTEIYLGVRARGGDSYSFHKRNQESGEYDRFTPAFYEQNMGIYKSCRPLQKPEVFDRDLQCKKADQSDEKVFHDEKNVCVADKIPDLSKLVDLVKQAVEQLRKINAMSQKPSAADYAGYNGLGAKAMAEIKAIEDEIGRMNLTENEKIKLGEELGKQMREKVMPYCDTIASLKRQIEAKGYGRFEDSNFNFDPKYLK